MTGHIPPPDFSLFSRFVDRELSPDEEREFRAYLQEHPEAQAQVTRLENVTQHITSALANISRLESVPSRQRSADCLSAEEITAYIARAVSPSEKTRIDGHLRTCDTCLLELVEARAITTLLDPAGLPPVPAHVQAQAEALWKPSRSRIVLQLVQHGLQHVTHVLTAPILTFDVEPLAAVTRSSVPAEQQPALTFRLDAVNASIRTTAIAARDGVTLTMTWMDKQQTALVGKHIQVRQEGRSIVMAKTNAQGRIQVPYLSPGVYEITCPDLQVAFQLDLLFEPEKG